MCSCRYGGPSRCREGALSVGLRDNPGKIPAIVCLFPTRLGKILRFSAAIAADHAINGPSTMASVTPRPGYRFPACLLMRESFMFEVNPVLNKLKELSERTELLRGYL